MKNQLLYKSKIKHFGLMIQEKMKKFLKYLKLKKFISLSKTEISNGRSSSSLVYLGKKFFKRFNKYLSQVNDIEKIN